MPPLVDRTQYPQAAAQIFGKAHSEPLVTHGKQPDRRGALESASLPPIAGKTTAPTVHISIGRVEVRAHVAPPQAPRPRAERPPTRSLADYLKRGGGKP